MVALLTSSAAASWAGEVGAHDAGDAQDGGASMDSRDGVGVGDAGVASDALESPADVEVNHTPRHVYETVVSPPALPEQVAREDRAAASSVITNQRTPRAAESVPELLAEQAGAIITRLGGLGATATISLRGSTANQVLVYVDGVPLNTPTGGGVDVGAIPLGDVERIEVYRGQSPIGFGASAIGGVVSLNTVVPAQDLVDVSAGGGSFGTYYGAGRVAWNRGGWHLYASARALSTDGDFAYVNSDGTNLVGTDDRAATRQNNDLHQLDGMVRAALDLPGKRQLRASVMVFDRDQGVPGASMFTTTDARLGSLRTTAILRYEDRAAEAGGVRATAYGVFMRSHFADPNHTLAHFATDARDRTYTAGATIDGRRALRPWLSAAGVLDGRYDRFLPTEALAAAPSGAPGTRLFGAAGIESDLWARPLALDVITSLRVEVAREAVSGRDNFSALRAASPPVSHVLPIARLSLVEQATGWLSLRANAGRYARLPSLVELYGNTGYLLGNPDLHPERGLNLDIGPTVSWRRDGAQVRWATAGFASWAYDLISYQFGGGRARAENIGSARILGVESSAELELGGHARLFASVTLTDARDTTSRETYAGKQLPLRPRLRSYARPEWRAIAVGRAISLGIYGDVDVTSGNYLDGPNIAPVATRVLFGAGLYARLPRGFCLRLSGRNLGNAAIYDLTNYPLPGREVYLTLAWSSANHQLED